MEELGEMYKKSESALKEEEAKNKELNEALSSVQLKASSFQIQQLDDIASENRLGKELRGLGARRGGEADRRTRSEERRMELTYKRGQK
jgi:hypothetical protein